MNIFYNKQGFTSFEFYFVMVVISLLVVVGIQRYLQLAEQIQRFSFETLAKNFSTSVTNAHSQWFIRHQEQSNENIVDLAGVNIQMSEQGWPMSVVGISSVQVSSLQSCHQLWMHLLQDAKPISYDGGDAFGSHPYHLSLSEEGKCRYQLIVDKSIQVFFDYFQDTGQVVIHNSIDQKN